jgi:hypothetical protein
MKKEKIYKIIFPRIHEYVLQNQDIEGVDDLSPFLYEIWKLLDEFGYNDTERNQTILDFIINFRKDGDYSNVEFKEKPENIDEMGIFNNFTNINDSRLTLSHHFNIPHFLISYYDDHWNFPTFKINHPDYDYYRYGVATYEQAYSSLREQLEDRITDDDTVIEYYGVDTYLEYIYISDTDKRMLSIDASTFRVDDLNEEEIIDELLYLGDNKSISLVDDYNILYELLEEENEEDSHKFELIRDKITELIDIGREILRDYFYKSEYEYIENDLIDWLLNYGYITSSNTYSTYEIEGDNLPDYISFNWIKFYSGNILNFYEDVSDLSDTGDVKEVFDESGVVYYIIELEY